MIIYLAGSFQPELFEKFTNHDSSFWGVLLTYKDMSGLKDNEGTNRFKNIKKLKNESKRITSKKSS
jgi:hypothetical protein